MSEQREQQREECLHGEKIDQYCWMCEKGFIPENARQKPTMKSPTNVSDKPIILKIITLAYRACMSKLDDVQKDFRSHMPKEDEKLDEYHKRRTEESGDNQAPIATEKCRHGTPKNLSCGVCATVYGIYLVAGLLFLLSFFGR